ncbi:MAG: Eco57I restriction-modification methylase domain-containing protein [Proteobacteria bacterium]|nr:Eco57I restriction-modification methylase domain-containing protein [Pseudomonadota bacterium]
MQLTIDLPASLPSEAYRVGLRASGETHGVVLTKPHVVDLILELAGYTSDRDLAQLRLLEPASGQGAFLLPAAERLLQAAGRHGRDPSELSTAIRAYDIDPEQVAIARRAVSALLIAHGVKRGVAQRLAAAWVIEGDFLLAREQPAYDVIVGNPPYVRIEQLAPVLQQEYRRRFSSIYDRADLYVAFIERALKLLSPEGVLSFVCADRWTLNKYGAPLRRLVTEAFGVRCYLDLHQASPFESAVIAYPAIFSIGRGKVARVKVAALKTATPDECQATLEALKTLDQGCSDGAAVAYESWFRGDEPWVLSSPEHLATLRQLEARLAPLETGDTRVRIGVATGNDRVYIVGSEADVEADRLVPLVLREDLVAGGIRDAKRFVINTFRPGSGLIDLADYPRLGRYLARHSEAVRARHVARSNPQRWFRTIDRVYPELVPVPKLLIPDIAGSNQVVLDEGRFHPHHNLYFVTSTAWDLRVLGALLSSTVALFFVWSYAVKMRGGYLRFQAQYLRRIRLPAPSAIEPRLAQALATAFERRDFVRIDALALRAYQLDVLPPFEFVDTRA